MPSVCIVRGCKSRHVTGQKDIHFHRLPKDKELSEKWIEICGAQKNRTSGFVCSLHFEKSSFERNLKCELLGLPVVAGQWKFKKGAVPTLHLPNRTTLETTTSSPKMPLKKNTSSERGMLPPRPKSPADTEEEQEEDLPYEGRVQATQKKRYRPSKKDIPDYPFTEAEVEKIVEFVKHHPCFYDKRDRQWSNSKLKLLLWRELAEKFPFCTYLQVRKFFEAKRTAFGKIEKKESISGRPARERTSREEGIMTTWSFLEGHIAHEPVQPSDRFSPQPLSPRPVTPDDDGSSSDLSGTSSTSVRKKSRDERRKRTHQDAPIVSPNIGEQTLAGIAIQELLHKTDLLTKKNEAEGYEAEIQHFTAYLCTKLRRVAPCNFSMLSSKLLDLVTAMEEPPVGETRLKNPKTILEGFFSSSSASNQRLNDLFSRLENWEG